MEKRYVAALLSGLVLPGAGQFYNGQPVKGVVYIMLTVCSIIVLVALIMRGVWRALEYAGSAGGSLWDALMREIGASRDPIVASVVILGIVWAAGIADAFVTARKGEDRPIQRFIARKG